MFEMPVLEELEVGTRYNSQITKVDVIHLDLSGADDLMDHHSIEPHSFGWHATDLTPPDKPLREAVSLWHLRNGVTSSRGGKRRGKETNRNNRMLLLIEKLQEALILSWWHSWIFVKTMFLLNIKQFYLTLLCLVLWFLSDNSENDLAFSFHYCRLNNSCVRC